MKATDAKKFIGKRVLYWKSGDARPRGGIVRATVGRNIELMHDWLWAPDIVKMELDPDQSGSTND